MAMNNQQQRIFESDISHSVAVSAGAGTGKSFTLMNKVIDLIKNQKVKPSQFLIVTFTNEAANSLKNKIKNEVRKYPQLTNIFSEVDAMHIDTIDAFRLFIVKKYGNRIGIRGDVNVVDESIYKLEQYKILDKIFDDLYQTKDSLFGEFLKDYIIKNDSEIKQLVITISNQLEINNLSREAVVQSLMKQFYSDEYFAQKANQYLKYLKTQIEQLVLELINIANDIPPLETKNGMVENTNRVLISERVDYFNHIDSLPQLVNALETLKSDGKRMNAKQSFDGYDRVREIFEELKAMKYFDYQKTKDIDFVLHQKYMPLFLGLAYDLKTVMNQFLTLHGVYTFNDIAHLALQVLQDQQSLQEIKNSFKLVMIDEYQDNSDLDDAFFTKISNNNIFVVGDVKQSIYGFKGANPEKFNDKFNSISKELEEIYHTPRYTMSINYRSRKEILDGVNQIFNKFMDLSFGGVEYQKDHHALEYKNNDKYDLAPEPKEEDVGIRYINALEPIELVDIYNELSGENVNESFAKKHRFLLTTALSILARINQGAKVTDGTTKQLVPVSFKDFAVLCRNNPDTEEARKIFSNLGIPVNIVNEEIINEDVMVVTLISLLQLILLKDQEEENYSRYKSYLASIMRSFLFCYDDQTIYDYLANVNYLQNEQKHEENLAYRSSEVYQKINDFIDRHQNSSLYDLVMDLFNEFHFVEKLSSIGNAISAINKFNKLLETIKGMDEINYSLEDLIYFFDHLKDLNLTVEARLSADSNNAVTVETIHKSKGLEWPIVYVECAKQFKVKTNQMPGLNSAYFAHKKYGYFFPRKTAIKNDNLGSTFFIYLCAELDEQVHVISEETRLLYVALTRAKETAICVFYPEKEQHIKNKKDVTSYQDIIHFTNVVLKEDIYLNGKKKLELNECQFINTPITLKDNHVAYLPILDQATRPSIELEDNIDKALLDKGIRYHSYMEQVDLINKDTSFIIEEKERKDIDKVLTNPLFTDLSKVKIYKEYKYYDDELDESGIIDLLLVYQDHVLIIDYKLKNASEEKYATQLDAYKKYVSKVFNLKAEAILLPLT